MDQSAKAVALQGKPTSVLAEAQDNAHHPPQGIVVIFGWLWSEEKQLRRYVDWWKEQGWTPHVITYPRWGLLSPAIAQRHLDGIVDRLADADAEKERTGQSRRLIFHTFSNLGFLGMGAILEILLRRQSPLLSNVCGAIIDSAPQARVSYKAYAAGLFTSAWPRSTYKKGDFRAAALRALLKVTVQGERKKRLQDVARAVYCMSAWPQLYIYSPADHVIPHSAVKRWIQGQEALGRRVAQLELEDSPHVQHMRKRPALYCDALAGFLAQLPGTADDSGFPRPSPEELLALPYPSHFLRKEPEQASRSIQATTSSTSSAVSVRSAARSDAPARVASVDSLAPSPSTPTISCKVKLVTREDSAEPGTLAPLAAWCRV